MSSALPHRWYQAEYQWEVSAGKVIGDQKSNHLTIDTSDLKDDTIKVTVRIHWKNSKCDWTLNNTIHLRDSTPLQQLPAVVDQTKENDPLSIEELRNAPMVTLIENTPFSLTAYPWRDFMPGSWGADGSPLMVALKVSNADKKALPTGIRMDRAWVLFAEQVWQTSDLRGRLPGQKPEKDTWIYCSRLTCETTIRNGPRWGPNVFIDVIVQLTDKEGRHYLLRATKQSITATS